MHDPNDLLAAEHEFFNALIAADAEALDRVLADDFILIDVMRGSEVTKPMLLAVVEAAQIQFATIEPGERRVRFYEATAVVTGRTQMSGRFGEAPFTVSSRYTHVFVDQQGRWRLVSAQGTPISSE